MKSSGNTELFCCLRKTRLARYLGVVFLGGMAAGVVQAANFDVGNPDVKISWDNTIKYSAGWRLRGIDSRVADNSIGPQANTNDGDQNFEKGAMISNRLDLLSEFDFRFKNAFGFRVSGAAWYDDVYHHSNDNPGVLRGGPAQLDRNLVFLSEFSAG